MIKNMLSRPIAELKGNDAGQPGSFSFQNVSKLATDMKKFFTVADEELRRKQDLYFENLKKQEIKRDIYHKEILLVLLQATTKKKFGEQKIKEKTRKKIVREVKKEKKKAETPSPKVETPKPKAEAPTPKAEAPVTKVETPKPKVEAPPTATVTPPAKTIGKTASKVAAAATVTTAALAGREALAKNIAKYESSGSAGRSFGGDEYNAYNKGTKGNKIVGATQPIDFSKMTISEYLRRSKLPIDDPDRLFAVGRYQIIPKTMQGLIKQLQIDPETTYLTPTTQDYLFSKGLIDINRKKVSDYIEGRTSGIDARNEAILELAKEFASIGVPFDTYRTEKVRQQDGSIKTVKVELKKGSSYYAGIGGNKAHNPPELVAQALEEDRAKRLKASPVEVPKIMGQQIDNTSVENRDMRKEISQTPTPVLIQQNNNTVSQPTTIISPKRQENINPILR